MDLGCGNRRHVIYFAKNDFDVSGFDRSELAIKRARELLEKDGLRADLRVFDMKKFPYPYEDEYFDAVVSTKVIHHSYLQEIRKMVREIERMTKKFGILYLQVPTYDKYERLKNEGIRFENLELGTLLPLDGEEKGIIHHYFGKEELFDILANYQIINFEEKLQHYCITGSKLK